jgi:hypothetical protein
MFMEAQELLLNDLLHGRWMIMADGAMEEEVQPDSDNELGNTPHAPDG